MEQQKKRAVIYARVSSQNERQDTTRQIKDLEKYAIGQDVKIEKIYEEHISGAKKMKKDEFYRIAWNTAFPIL